MTIVQPRSSNPHWSSVIQETITLTAIISKMSAATLPFMLKTVHMGGLAKFV